MKDSILIKRNGKGYTLTRTLSEGGLTDKDIHERIKSMEANIEAYTDTKEHLEKNKETILKEQAEKIDNDIKEYGRAIKNLEDNIKALKDGLVLGQGKNSIETKGDTVRGVVQ